MAVVSLIITDADLDAGTYKVDFAAQGNELDDGQATAAYFTGFYLYTLVNTPDFLAGLTSYGLRLMDDMKAKGHPLNTTEPATMTLTLEDEDIVKGRFTPYLETSGGDETGESLPTPAQVVGSYMRFLVTDLNFREKCWAFAEEFAANNDGRVSNPDYAPAFVNDDTDAASAA